MQMLLINMQMLCRSELQELIVSWKYFNTFEMLEGVKWKKRG